MFRTALAGALALGCLAMPALADGPSHCAALSIPKGAFSAHDGQWVEVTPEQYHFLQGVYALNPMTPKGLPYGDRAVLATTEDAPGGLIFFIDGDRACTPMPVPRELVEMMRDVALGVVNHEGASN
jgi:hypothetical protein